MWKRSSCGGRPRHRPGRPHGAGGRRSASATTAPPVPTPPAAAKSGWSPSRPLWLLCAQVGGAGRCAPAHRPGQGVSLQTLDPREAGVRGVGGGQGSRAPQALPTSHRGLVPALQAPQSPGSAGTPSSARMSWTPSSPTSTRGLLQPVHAVSPLLPTPPAQPGQRGRGQARSPGGWMSAGQPRPLAQGPEGRAFLAGGTGRGMGRVWRSSRAEAGTVSRGARGSLATGLEAGAVTLRSDVGVCAVCTQERVCKGMTVHTGERV